jgi:hypothetical protein
MNPKASSILCPSAQPTMPDSVAFGIIEGTSSAPRMTHFAELQPVTDELLALAEPVTPTEIFRFAAPCANKGCQHFDGSTCRLATQIVEVLPPVVSDLPPCQVRSQCRWWQQEGRSACLRCPQVVTDIYLEPAPVQI